MAEACSKTKDWLALVVKPQHERAVAECIASKAIESYVPLYRERRQWSDRVKTLERPLFPSYVFCRSSFDDRFIALRTPGVFSVVSFAGKPATILDEEIEAVKAVVSSGLPVSPWKSLQVGERVRIGRGPLTGLEGILAVEKSSFRVIVNVNLLCRGVAVEVDRDFLSPVHAN